MQLLSTRHGLRSTPTLSDWVRPPCALAALRYLTALLALSLAVGVASAADHYVRAGASGNGTGSDWINACGDFTGSCAVGSLVRGDTYYVAAGTYASRTWNRATNGSLVITIRRATIADHGTGTGWSDAYDGQVAWGAGQDFTTGYWTFDGVSTSDPKSVDAYGFRILNPASCTTDQVSSDVTAPNVTFRYTAANLCGAAYNNIQYCWHVHPGADNHTLSHVYCGNANALLQTDGGGVSNGLYEYAYVYGHWSSAQHHGEVWQLVCTNCTLRYNYIDNCEGTACISGNAGTAPGAPSMIPIYQGAIYGNVFNRANGGNGVVGMAGSTGIAYTKFYNNTITNQSTGSNFYECNSPCPSGAGHNTIVNNIFWNGICGSTLLASGNTIDYNSYLSCKGSAPSEPHGQVASLNPFVAAAANNFDLAADTSSWTPLPPPYNVDGDGIVRTSSRGAYQYGGSAQAPGPAPAPPQGLQVTVR